MKKFLSVFLTVTFIMLMFSGCAEKRPKSADKDFYYNLSSDPETLDPQICTDENGINAIIALFEGLTRNCGGEALPAGALSWETNADSTVFTFKLREDSEWRNRDTDSDEPLYVTADDYVFAFRRAVDPKTNSKNARSFFCIKNASQINEGSLPTEALGVQAAGSYTLVITLEYSYPDFPLLLSSPSFVPCNRAFFESTNGKYGLESKYLLTNGPFRFSGYYAWEHNSYIKLVRNSSYGKTLDVWPSSLTFYIGGKDIDISDPTQALTEKTVDVLSLNKEHLQDAEEAGITVVSQNSSTAGLCINTKDELLKNKDIREAFIRSIDRDALLSKLPDGLQPANDIISSEMLFMGKSYRAAAGSDFYAKQNPDVLSALSPALSSLNLSTMPSISVMCADDENIKLLVNEIIISWNKTFGNFFNITPVSQDELINNIQTGNYQIALCEISPAGSSPEDLLSQFMSSSHYNPAGLQSAEYDALLSSSSAGELSAYVSAEKYLNDNYIFYPIYYEDVYYGIAPGVSGVEIFPYNSGIDFIHGLIEEE